MLNMQKHMIEHMFFPMMEIVKGNRIRAKLSELLETESSETLGEIQRASLKELLCYCAEHVPAYKNLGLRIEDIEKDPVKVLTEKIKPLKKLEFQGKAELYLSDCINPEERIANCTGGSTGEPIHFYMTRSQVEYYEAARWRGLSWFDITPGSRSVMIWGNPVELNAYNQRKHQMKEQLLKNRRIISAYTMSQKDADKYAEFLNKYRPEYLYGYSNILTEFAKIVKSAYLDIKLKAVVSTAETLTPEQIALISDVFKCPVVNEYGARDAGILAYTCPKGHLHISAENCFIEILDPITFAPLPAGKSGLIAITDLRNRVQPRLRYMLGDVGIISEKSCECGRKLPVLEKIEGREDALLLGEGGILIHGNLIGQVLRPIAGIRSFQLRQHTPDKATLFIVPVDGETVDIEAFMPTFSKTLPGIKVEVKFVDSIKPAPSGKIRYAIREFDL